MTETEREQYEEYLKSYEGQAYRCMSFREWKEKSKSSKFMSDWDKTIRGLK